MQMVECSFIFGVDSFVGCDDVVIKLFEDFWLKGVVGVMMLLNGQIVFILDIKELFVDIGQYFDMVVSLWKFDFV